MESEIWHTLQRTPTFLDGTGHPLEFDRSEVERFYLPLAETILKRRLPERRMIVAVAGPPGCGKTAFAETLSAVINALAGEKRSVMVGLDGWHFPNAYLDEHTISREGKTFSLRQIKGAPETYDHQAIRLFLDRAPLTNQLTFPVYSREKHDPIPDAGMIGPAQRILILEGNYWLLDADPWRGFQACFDYRIALTAAPEALLGGLRDRHLRGGKPLDWIMEHIRRVDLANIDFVLSHSASADVVVEKTDSRRIKSLVWQDRVNH